MPLNMLFSFLRLFRYVYINEAFVKNFMKKLSFFNTNFQNSFLTEYYDLNLVILNWRFFDLRSEIGIFDIFFKRLHEEGFEDLQINSNWKFQTRNNISHKWQPFQVFAKLYKSLLLIATIVRGAVSGLKQPFGN